MKINLPFPVTTFCIVPEYDVIYYMDQASERIATIKLDGLLKEIE